MIRHIKSNFKTITCQSFFPLLLLTFAENKSDNFVVNRFKHGGGGGSSEKLKPFFPLWYFEKVRGGLLHRDLVKERPLQRQPMWSCARIFLFNANVPLIRKQKKTNILLKPFTFFAWAANMEKRVGFCEALFADRERNGFISCLPCLKKNEKPIRENKKQTLDVHSCVYIDMNDG